MNDRRRKLALIATKGTLDMGYPPFVLASTAAALGFEVAIFFSFYGLELLRKDLGHLRVSPLGNPAMPAPVPMPSLVAALPGMEGMATRMMKTTMRKKGIASLEDLRTACTEAGVRFVACDMTLEMFGMTSEQLVGEHEIGGAATFLDFAADADIQLFV